MLQQLFERIMGPSLDQLYQELRGFEWTYRASQIVPESDVISRIERAPISIANIAAVITDDSTLESFRTRLLKQYRDSLWQAVLQRKSA